MRRRLRATVLAALAIAVVGVVLGHQAPVDAAPAQTEDPTTPILAVVSPLALPACSAAGSATLLVPILGGLAGSTLGVDGSIDVGDLVLDVVGPLYVVCGTLPSSIGTRCELDANIAGLWPAELAGFGMSSPVVVGNLTDSLNALLALLGQPPVAEVAQTLQCFVPEGAGAIDAPPAPPPVGDVVVPGAPLGGLAGPSVGGLPALDPPVVSAPSRPAADVPVVGALVSTLDERVPGGVRALQVVFAVALLLCLVRSWYTSWRITRADAADGG